MVNGAPPFVLNFVRPHGGRYVGTPPPARYARDSPRRAPASALPPAPAATVRRTVPTGGPRAPARLFYLSLFVPREGSGWWIPKRVKYRRLASRAWRQRGG